jgi:N4-gp56 family major capsid protein
MATTISNAFVTLFDAQVKQAYQGQRQLAGLVRERSNVEGSTVKFPKIGKGSATQAIPNVDVTPMSVSFSSVTATMVDYNAAEYTSVFNQQKVNFDERRELVQVVAGAMGRRMDQIVLDALSASGTSLTVSNDIGGTDTDLNVAKLREAKRLMDKNNVPSDGRCIIVHANSLESLLGETAVISADYNSVRALVTGEVNTFLGFKFITMGDRSEGGLPVDGSSDRTLYAFHKDAAGLGVGLNMKTEINYVPEKTSWLVNGIFSAGAIAIDDEGIVKLTCRE